MSNEQTWELDDCRVIREGDALKVIMDGDDGYRMMEVLSGDNIDEDVARLDDGESPVDLWEDGNGSTVCYGNGRPCDEDGNPMVDVYFTWKGETYRVRVPDAGEDVWACLERHDRDENDEICDRLDSDNILAVGEYPGRATSIDCWLQVDDYDDESLEDFVETTLVQDTPDSLIEAADGDVQRAADEWVRWWFEENPEADDLRLRLKEQYRMTPESMRGWMARYLAENRTEYPEEISSILKIVGNGNALAVNCTREIRALGLDRGDRVKVTFERI